jgi:hypothetical protein
MPPIHTVPAFHTAIGGAATTVAVNSSEARFLAVFAGYDTPITLTDTYSNPWTPLTARSSGGSLSGRWYYVNSQTPLVGPGHQVSVAPYAAGFLAFLGFPLTRPSPFDQVGGQGATSGVTGNTSSAGQTPAMADELVLTGVALGGNGANALIGFGLPPFLQLDAVTAVSGVSYGGGIGYIPAQSSIFLDAWSWDNSSPYAISTALFKAPFAPALPINTPLDWLQGTAQVYRRQ